MNILDELRLGDMDKVRRLHEKFYKNEFEIPPRDLLRKIKIARDRNQIIGFAAIRPINEVIMVLDKDKHVKTRYQIIKEFLDSNDEQLHAFVQDGYFIRALINHFEFKRTKGIALVRQING